MSKRIPVYIDDTGEIVYLPHDTQVRMTFGPADPERTGLRLGDVERRGEISSPGFTLPDGRRAYVESWAGEAHRLRAALAPFQKAAETVRRALTADGVLERGQAYEQAMGDMREAALALPTGEDRWA